MKDGVVLKIITDKTVYEPGQTVLVTVAAVNTNDIPMKYAMMNIGDPSIYVGVGASSAQYDRPLWEAGSAGRIVQEAETEDTLAARASIVRDVVWDQTLSEGGALMQAKSGQYIISAHFIVGGLRADGKYDGLTVATSIEIVDTASQASQGTRLWIPARGPEWTGYLASC